MKHFFTIVFFISSFYANAQTICGTANENGVVTLTAPAGYVFTSIDFASYGTPTGSCGSFATGGCHAPNSLSICQTAFLNKNSASVSASNAVFGDPCGGTPKQLYVQATYSLALPLKLVSFTGRQSAQAVALKWSSANEHNTSHFIIERSTDGISFTASGSVPAIGNGENNYQFTSKIASEVPQYFYRLKIYDKDGRFQLSNVVRITINHTASALSVFPSPATHTVTILNNKVQEAIITNTTGLVMKNILLINGSITLDIATWQPGIYFIKTADEVKKVFKQ